MERIRVTADSPTVTVRPHLSDPARHVIEFTSSRPVLDGTLADLAQFADRLIRQIPAPDAGNDDEHMRWNNHNNGLGDWCPWSGKPVTDHTDGEDTCPAGCRKSHPTDDPND